MSPIITVGEKFQKGLQRFLSPNFRLHFLFIGMAILFCFGCWDPTGLSEIKGTRFAGETVEFTKEISLENYYLFYIVFEVSPDGKLALYGNLDSSSSQGISLLDLQSGEKLLTLNAPSPQCVSFSHDGTRAISGGKEGILHVWDLCTGREIGSRKEHSDYIRSMAWSSAGDRVVTGGDDQKIILWDLQNLKPEQTFAKHTSGIRHYCLDWTSEGSRFLSGSWDGSIRFWDTETGEELVRMSPGYGRIMGISVSPDGRYALSSSINGPNQPIILWDLQTGREVKRYGIPRNGVGWRLHAVSLDFSPDGKTALFGMNYGSVIWWDIEAWKAIRIVRMFKEELVYVSFIDGGNTAIAVGCDKDSSMGETIVRCWRLPMQENNAQHGIIPSGD